MIAARSTRALPILSPNLCLMWRAVTTVTGGVSDRETLLSWTAGGPRWLGRFRDYTGTGA